MRYPRKCPPFGAFRLSPVEPIPPFPDDNNCSVYAIHQATGIPMEEAYYNLLAAGRVRHRGVTAMVMEKALGQKMTPSKGTVFCPSVGGYIVIHRRKLPTMSQWLREYPEGTYIVFYTGHFTVIVDGVQVDRSSSMYKPRSRVIGHWRIR